MAEHLPGDLRHDADAQQRAEEIRCVEGDGNALHNEGTEQHDQCDGADKAQFLAHDGEDKVVLGVGQPLVLLHAVADAHAEQTAGGDGVDALAGLPQHTGGIGRGQAPDAAQTLRRITVAGGQRLDKIRQDSHTGRDSNSPQLYAACPGAHQHGGKDHGHQQHGRVVGFQLQQNQNGDQQAGGLENTLEQAFDLPLVMVQNIRRAQNDGKLGQLRWLQGHAARQVDPAVAAVIVTGHEQRQHQQADEGTFIFAPDDGHYQLRQHDQPQGHISGEHRRLLVNGLLQPPGRISGFGRFFHKGSFPAQHCAAVVFSAWYHIPGQNATKNVTKIVAAFLDKRPAVW